ncbi:hypothetical protein [Pseudomonas agarici]|uniref:hypothetical protein n=1 Tax=Pseudomonas agarici TaxID=46677 RepID=UPI0002FA5796|nr:hypothetical protein [Pseudomonas agarici]NWB93326.1 hypothetical protein [Pseudomonas agarici]NWC10079.1 hypothetical protein [Pseudomonas agarici]SEL52152.1 hypothetical protein SAMN05216604_12113 [Pseudomonas agarici]
MKWALVMASSTGGFYVSEIKESEHKPAYHPTHIRAWRWIAVDPSVEVYVGDVWRGHSFRSPQVGQKKDHHNLE